MFRRARYLAEIVRRRKIACALMTIVIEQAERTRKNERAVWTTPYLFRRDERGMHHNLFLELAFEDPNRFRRCLRMDTDTFEYLLNKVSPLIQKQNTHLRKSIPPAERLSVTLRHLATGESQESLRLSFRIGQSTISGIIKEVCSAIYTVLHEEYLKVPKSADEWRIVANDYGIRWNFYNCIGAMDGKHFRIESPLRSGSLYYNYKDFFSVVLLAMVDAQLRFIFVDIGANGRASDRGIWNRCALKHHIEQKSLKIPKATPLPHTNTSFPYVIVADEGFTLSTNVLLPYPKESCKNRQDRKIFNYRLSRARRCSENAFGVLGARFQLFRSAMKYDPDDVRKIILAACCIHNMLRSQSVGRAMYTPPDFLDEEDVDLGQIRQGEWREDIANGIANLANQGGNRHKACAIALRDEWCTYFNTVGAVP